MAADSTTPRPVFPAGSEQELIRLAQQAADKRARPAASKAVAVRKPDICWYCGDELRGKYSEISKQTGSHTCSYSPTGVHELAEVPGTCWNCDGSGQCLDCGAVGCDTCGFGGTCAICEGSGSLDEDNMPYWEGDNYVSTREREREAARPAPGTQVCSRCGGTGEAPNVTLKGVACGMCQGTGKPSKASGGKGSYAPSYGLGYQSNYKSVGYYQKPLALPTSDAEAVTWRNIPWTSWDSKDAAKSDNMFVKTYGLYRDLQLNYHSCPAGRHWGPYGGAGMVPWSVAPDGKVYVLLSHRSMAVEQGGTWSSFGGAIDKKDGEVETPFKAAIRETFEEVEGLPAKGVVTLEVNRPCTTGGCGWSYTTFLVQVEAAKVRVNRTQGSGWETSEVKWVPVDEVSRYNLHPGFAKTWPELYDAIKGASK